MSDVGDPFHTCGPYMQPVDGLFRDAAEPRPVKARAEIDSIEFGTTGRLRFIFDCGIEDAAGSWPFAIGLSELSYAYVEDSPEAARFLATALEAEAARLRLMSLEMA